MHYKSLEFHLKHGLVLKKVRIVLAFTESPNLKEYINDNFDILFEEGLAKENELSKPSIKERLESVEEMELERLMS